MEMAPQERIGLHLKRAEQELMAAKHAALRPFGLTVPQYSALYTLASSPGISAAALARFCLVTPQTIATILTNLQAKGLISRRPHPYHRKVAEVQLTEEGRRILGLADARAVAIEAHLADGFSTEERAKLIELLGRAAERLSDNS